MRRRIAFNAQAYHQKAMEDARTRRAGSAHSERFAKQTITLSGRFIISRNRSCGW